MAQVEWTVALAFIIYLRTKLFTYFCSCWWWCRWGESKSGTQLFSSKGRDTGREATIMKSVWSNQKAAACHCHRPIHTSRIPSRVKELGRGLHVSEQRTPTAILFISQVIYEHGEPWWNYIDKGKLLIRPQVLSGNPTSRVI